MKSRSLPVDAVIFDLEDAVADEAKAAARQILASELQNPAPAGQLRAVRMNAPGTADGEEDLRAVGLSRPQIVLVPKVRSARELSGVASVLPRETAIWAMIETPHAVQHIADIAALADTEVPVLQALVMGDNDLAKETGVSSHQMDPWRMQCVLAAKTAGLPLLDGVYNKLDDEVGFRQSCAQAKARGMNGKTLIHPGQISACNEVFTPSSAETARAEAIVAAFSKEEAEGKNVLVVEGEMVERLHFEAAVRLLEERDQIDAKTARQENSRDAARPEPS